MKSLTKAKVLILTLFCVLCIAVPVIIGNSPAAGTVSDENGEGIIESVTEETIEDVSETADLTEISSEAPDTEEFETGETTESSTEDDTIITTTSDMLPELPENAFPETSDDAFTDFTLTEEPEDNVPPAPALTPLTSEAEQKLKEDFLVTWFFYKDMTADDIDVICYYGTYNGGEVVVLCPEIFFYDDPIMHAYAGGYYFAFPGMIPDIQYHIDSTFMNLDDAYEAGYINDDDMMEIYYHSEQLYPWDVYGYPEIYDED
ncbi:MAG: hypothetical protein J1E40_13390 [Oscillospiraceae bacterium]|nr:hypothetical protein [Oscillospiraceae bacterium]